MNKNNRAGLIPEEFLKNILKAPNTWHCDVEVLVKIAGKSCDTFYACSDCIDYTINWFYGEESVND